MGRKERDKRLKVSVSPHARDRWFEYIGPAKIQSIAHRVSVGLYNQIRSGAKLDHTEAVHCQITSDLFAVCVPSLEGGWEVRTFHKGELGVPTVSTSGEKIKFGREFKTTLEKVKFILENYPQTRNSDNELRARYLVEFHIDEIKKWSSKPSNAFLPTVMLRELFAIGPSYETLRRCRQRIQQEHPELQPVGPVRRRRQLREEQHRKMFGNRK